MTDERAQRRLAAILAADVVGYSRLMQADEASTLAALKSRRNEILQPVVSKHHGRVVKLMGDGVLVEFASAVNAVTCAVELQQAMDVANRGIPEDRRIVLRIGINIGDVVVEGGDLYGDGVNKAARIEALADPGTIYLSETVYNHVRGKVPHNFEDLGQRTLKNIAESVRIYRVSGTAPSAALDTSIKGASHKPGVAVLPFTDMSQDAEQQYLCDGITEDIITELSRYRELFVIARNSSFQYRGKPVDMKRIGRELGVEYLVEGSIRKAGNRLRITAQLIEAATGSHVWADRFNRELIDVFDIQDEVAQTIASTLVSRVSRSATEHTRRKPTESWEAYDYVLQAIDHNDRWEIDQAIELLQRALKIDPQYVQVYADLAENYVVQYAMCLGDHYLKSALTLAQTGLSIDDNDPRCQTAMGLAQTYNRQFDLAEYHFAKARSLNPNSVQIASQNAFCMSKFGRPAEALSVLDTAALRDPHRPIWHYQYRAGILFEGRRYEESVETFNRVNPKQYWDHGYLAAAYALLGREREARTEIAETLRMRPDMTISKWAKAEPFKNPADLEHLLDGLRKAGLPE